MSWNNFILAYIVPLHIFRCKALIQRRQIHNFHWYRNDIIPKKHNGILCESSQNTCVNKKQANWVFPTSKRNSKFPYHNNAVYSFVIVTLKLRTNFVIFNCLSIQTIQNWYLYENYANSCKTFNWCSYGECG